MVAQGHVVGVGLATEVAPEFFEDSVEVRSEHSRHLPDASDQRDLCLIHQHFSIFMEIN